jgi:cytochrome c-type biogenesis protein CcmE
MLNQNHQRKLKVFLLFAIGLAIAFSLIIFSLRQNLNVFVSPTELTKISRNEKALFRLGGMVKPNSVIRTVGQQGVSFIVTDNKHDIKVTYNGLLPDLFREGTGVIVEGYLTHVGDFRATNVLAKHDENYMPKSSYLALRKQSA